MMKAFLRFRIFFIAAIFVSCIIDLVGTGPISVPMTQLLVASLAGIAAVFAAKLAHIA